MASHLHLAPSPTETGSPIGAASPILVVLADDHALMRRSLRLLLDGEANMEVIAEAADLASVERHVQGHQPHVLVLDLSMPGGSSIEAIGQLRERAPETQIVVHDDGGQRGFAQRAFAAGAIGFVQKDLADTELPRGVRAAARGEEYASPRVAARLDALHRALTEDKLSAREVEVLRLIALGHTSVEIAHKLHLSPRTVETHRARIHKARGRHAGRTGPLRATTRSARKLKALRVQQLGRGGVRQACRDQGALLAGVDARGAAGETHSLVHPRQPKP